MIKNGTWTEKNLLKITRKDGRSISIKYRIKHVFELGSVYIGNTNILFVIEKKFKKYLDNFIQKNKKIVYMEEDVKKEFKKYLPDINCDFETNNGKLCLVLNKTPDVIQLGDLLTYFNGSVPVKHVMWIMSSMYNTVCFLYFNKITVNALTINNYYISPKYHSGLILDGWWFSTFHNEELTAVPQEVYDILPPDMIANKETNILLDLNSIKLLGRTLLGDSTGMTLSSNPDILKPLIDWLQSPAINDPVKEYKNWEDTIIKCYGKKSFTPLDINIDDFYNKIIS